MYALFLEQVAQKQVSLKTYDIEISVGEKFFFGENVEGISINVVSLLFFFSPDRDQLSPGQVRQRCDDCYSMGFAKHVLML